MLGLHKYLTKIYDIKWLIPDKDVESLGQLLYVTFRKENSFYLIENIHYTYVDILLGLEGVDFKMLKEGDDLKIRIIKI